MKREKCHAKQQCVDSGHGSPHGQALPAPKRGRSVAGMQSPTGNQGVRALRGNRLLFRNTADGRSPCAWFGLGEKSDAMVKDLSSGQRQRLFIVLALTPQPQGRVLGRAADGFGCEGAPQTCG